MRNSTRLAKPKKRWLRKRLILIDQDALGCSGTSVVAKIDRGRSERIVQIRLSSKFLAFYMLLLEPDESQDFLTPGDFSCFR